MSSLGICHQLDIQCIAILCSAAVFLVTRLASTSQRSYFWSDTSFLYISQTTDQEIPSYLCDPICRGYRRAGPQLPHVDGALGQSAHHAPCQAVWLQQCQMFVQPPQCIMRLLRRHVVHRYRGQLHSRSGAEAEGLDPARQQGKVL